nr:MAG TPA_asm: hypothetical protein [Caudoviricetes sp.]
MSLPLRFNDKAVDNSVQKHFTDRRKRRRRWGAVLWITLG